MIQYLGYHPHSPHDMLYTVEHVRCKWFGPERCTVILENYNATAQVLTRNQLVMDVSRLHQLVGNSALHL